MSHSKIASAFAQGSAAEPRSNTGGTGAVNFSVVSTPRKTFSSAAQWFAFAIAATILIAHALRYLPLFDDDAFISLRYADRLINGHGLTWTDGPRVEGYSNLLWILLIAAMGHFGVDLVVAARCLGILFSIGAIAAVGLSRPRDEVRSLPLLIGLLVLPLCIPIAVWSIAGLEQPLIACLLAWSIAFVRIAQDRQFSKQHIAASSILLGLLCLTRPDSPLLAAAVIISMSLAKGTGKERRVAALGLSIGPAIAIVGQQIFRVAYYGHWVPNPALVKIAPSARHFKDGLEYVTGGFAAIWPIALLAVIALAINLRDARLRSRHYPLVLVLVVWSAWLVFVGGDIFAAWRQFVPLVVVIAFILTDAACQIWQRLQSLAARAAVSILFIATFAGNLWTQSRDYANQRALSQHSEWHGRTVGRMLKRTFGECSPLIAVDAAGSVPFWSRLPSLDMLGLNDEYIPRHPPRDFGKGFVGHELGDGAYVLSQRPDLILFRGPQGQKDAAYLSGQQMQASPHFTRDYALVTFESAAPERFQSRIWVRRASSKIGIRETPGGIEIPAYLLSSGSEVIAKESNSDGFVVNLCSTNIAAIERLAIAPGTWRLVVDPACAIIATIESAAGPIATGATPLNFDIRSAADSPIRIELRATGICSISTVALNRIDN